MGLVRLSCISRFELHFRTCQRSVYSFEHVLNNPRIAFATCVIHKRHNKVHLNIQGSVIIEKMNIVFITTSLIEINKAKQNLRLSKIKSLISGSNLGTVDLENMTDPLTSSPIFLSYLQEQHEGFLLEPTEVQVAFTSGPHSFRPALLPPTRPQIF